MTTTYRVELQADDRTREALTARGLFVPSGTAPALFASAEVNCVLPTGEERVCAGQVVNTTPSGFYVLFPAETDLSPLLEALDPTRASGPASDDDAHLTEEDVAFEGEEEGADDPSAGETATPGRNMPKPVWKMIDYGSEISVRKQIADMSVADKLRLARGAKRPVRAILVRDSEKRVHLQVVKNPKVTDDEIVEYSGIANLSPGALRWIATQKKYTRRLNVRMNLILNRNTPQDAALRLMKGLSTANLRRVMQSSKAREPLQRAARKKLMQDGHI